MDLFMDVFVWKNKFQTSSHALAIGFSFECLHSPRLNFPLYVQL